MSGDATGPACRRHFVARQRRHRLVIETEPEQFADADTDPLALGKEALDKLHRVRQGLGAQVTARAYLDEASELVRRLAHGPQGGLSPCETCPALR